MQLGKLHEAEAPLRELGFRIVAVSADRPEKLRESVRKHDLGYTLLSDSKLEAARAFGIAFQVDAATLEKFAELGIDLEEASGETHHQLPVPSVFLVGTDGVIRFRYSNPDHRVRIDNEALLTAAREVAPAAE